jgi:hypothetical protein
MDCRIGVLQIKSCEMQVGDLKKTNTDGKKLEEAFYAVDNHTSLSSVVEGSDSCGCRIPEIETIADIE